MAKAEDVKMVVDAINAAMAEGDGINGMIFNKPVAEWKDIFNEAAKQLNMSVQVLDPLQGGTERDIMKTVVDLQMAFYATGGKSGVILADTTGNHLSNNPNVDLAISNLTGELIERNPKAIFLQVIPDANRDTMWLYSQKPNKPQNSNGPVVTVK